MSSEELRIARNEIFARYGRMFNDVELQNYFNKCSWYEPLIKPENFNENQLNEYEKANIQLIKQHEKAANSRSESIYFAGIYTDGNGIYIDMQQYSSPGQTVYGLNAGYIEILGDKIQLYENRTNIYMSEDGSLQIQVKENSIVLTGKMTFSQTGETFDVSGEYNLQRRYPRP
ncbi:MAG: YARHG domain-containing protein [Peptoanaerobacter stomatis]